MPRSRLILSSSRLLAGGIRHCVETGGIGNLTAVKSPNVDSDQLVLIRIEGMHCHRCEQTIQKALSCHPGVHEVEVDFNSGQASILFDPGPVAVAQLMEAVNEAGYQASGFTQVRVDRAGHS